MPRHLISDAHSLVSFQDEMVKVANTAIESLPDHYLAWNKVDLEGLDLQSLIE